MRFPQIYRFLFNMRFFTQRPSDLEARASFGSKSHGAPAPPPSNASIPLISTPKSTTSGASAVPASTPVGSPKLAEFLEKYDPRPHGLPSLFPMSEHRAMLRTMFLDNILFSTARLHKHNWILLSQNEKYKECLYFPVFLVLASFISSRLLSSPLVSSRLLSSPLLSSPLVSSRLVSSRLLPSPLLPHPHPTK